MELQNFNINLNNIILLIYFFSLGVVYFLMFRKHHKRNELNYVDISKRVIKYLVVMTILIFILILAIDMFITGMLYQDDRIERIYNFILSILIVSGDLIYFVAYIKLSLKDIINSEKEEEDRQTKNMGEILQVILLTVVILMPIWKIPEFIKTYNNMIENKELIIEIGKTLGYSIIGIFLLISLNPMNVKKSLFKNKG